MMEAFIVDFIRTPIGRYGGVLSSIRTDDLAALPIRTLLERHREIDPAAIDEVILGCANQAGEDNRNVARMATLLAGLPETVPGLTVNRLCASGLDAVIAAARAVRTGEADLVIAGGVESMSRAPLVMPKAEAAFSRNTELYDTTIGWRFVNPLMKTRYGIDSMPETAENVAADYQISRADQDAYAAQSQTRAVKAQESGRFAEEIVAVPVPQKKGETLSVATDEHPRAGTTVEKLSKLPTPFRNPGTVTAGNSPGVNDGAAALLIASERAVAKYGLAPLARVVGAASVGVAPRIMGIGPVPATEKLMRRQGWKIGDFDIIELNEAFAAQVLAVTRALAITAEDENFNPNGGAIALGHPLGASGARIAGTAALELKKRGGKRALVTLCVGVGQGVALALER
ncbi:3-oxoadipyl-CoA thiolase [Nordella sp. HKS 07]|uniref:3-oxoadipyl-CoA thiolase n=1 Tax=Nordella sp. HKS 07 TaxID=2712222 RepID=UPI0013E200DA|nr:3-oxoadipyl-CoA thiolase [Nordella sp. HKS 07]QIG52390.1 3-oxoadipyl-CoA thiolase [Nordella sp. HKS 07]